MILPGELFFNKKTLITDIKVSHLLFLLNLLMYLFLSLPEDFSFQNRQLFNDITKADNYKTLNYMYYQTLDKKF